jgi:predicted acyl esterase
MFSLCHTLTNPIRSTYVTEMDYINQLSAKLLNFAFTSWFGSAEGRDGFDIVQHIAQLPWCNGSLCMAGCSWLAISQWETAAERPPSLKCIAPWGGSTDIYREIICQGGVPFAPYVEWATSTLRGNPPIGMFPNHLVFRMFSMSC